jgi:uncharacterized phiE125 gp8 family phage protein
MPAILLTPPAAEPLTLSEAKLYLRIDTDAEDDFVGALIAAARTHVEARTRRALVAQTWRFVFDDWPPDGRIALRLAPLQSVVTARVYDAAGAAHALDSGTFVVDAAASVLAWPPWAVPAPGREAAGIEIDVVAGYGDAGGDVPETLRQAVRLLIAHWYENRALVAPGQQVAALPATVEALLAPYRVVSL